MAEPAIAEGRRGMADRQSPSKGRRIPPAISLTGAAAPDYQENSNVQ